MKIFYLFFFIISFSTFGNDVLVRPIMHEQILKRISKSLKYSPHKCHDETQQHTKQYKLSFKKVNTDYFDAKIECRYSCDGKKFFEEIINKKFSPLKLSLYEGDGSSTDKVIWRSLGFTINIWSQQMCLDQALNRCEKRVEDFTVKEVSSGNWSLNNKLDCSQQKVIYSPFDEQYRLDNSGKPHYIPFKEISTFRQNQLEEFFINDSKDDLEKLYNNKTCKSFIKVHTCFGDCIWETKNKNKPWAETLATKEFFGEENFTLCSDKLELFFKGKNYSKSEKKFKCEKYVWEFLRKTELTGSSCSALRVESDCDKF